MSFLLNVIRGNSKLAFKLLYGGLGFACSRYSVGFWGKPLHKPRSVSTIAATVENKKTPPLTLGWVPCLCTLKGYFCLC